MTTWHELEEKFTELHQLFSSLGGRIDRTWGQGRDDQWRIAGGVGSLNESRFVSLSVMAGRLVETLPDGLVSSEIRAEVQPLLRWMRAIWNFGRPTIHHAIEQSDNREGSVLLLGTLNDPAAVSANLCLHLSAHTLQVIGRLDQELRAPRYEAVLGHWERAHSFLNGPSADLPNAVKEAVSSVEALAQVIARRPTATLGECIKDLRASKRLQPPLLRGIEELWGFANASPGVRHGSAATPTLSSAEATYVFDQTAGALRLLLSLDRAV